MMKRPDRETALRLLAADGQVVTATEPDLLEDVDGLPLAAGVQTYDATLHVTPELLGWTWAALDPEHEVDQ